MQRSRLKASAVALLLVLLGSLLGVFIFQTGFAELNPPKTEAPSFEVTMAPRETIQLALNQTQIFVATANSQDSTLTYVWSVETTSIDTTPSNGTNYSLKTEQNQASFRFLGNSLQNVWLVVTAQTNQQSTKAVVRIENLQTLPTPSPAPTPKTTPNTTPQPNNYQPPAQSAATSAASNSFQTSTFSFIVQPDSNGQYVAINTATGAVTYQSYDAGVVITNAWNIAPTFIRNGIYVCNTPITAYTGYLRLVGESRSGTIIRYNGIESAIAVVGPSDQEMKNAVDIGTLTVDGQNIATNGIRLENASISRITNVEVRNFVNNGITYGTNCWSGILQDSYIHNNKNAGVQLHDDANEIRIENSIINDDKIGILVSGHIDQLIVQRSQFTRQVLGCIYAMDGIGVVDVTGNYFENSTTNLIVFNPTKDNVINNGLISSNFFSIAKQYAIVANNTYNLVITGNRYQLIDLGEINFGSTTSRNLVNEPLQTIRVTGLGTNNAMITLTHTPDNAYAIRFNNMNIGQNTITNQTTTTFPHGLAKKPLHVDVSWQTVGYGNWAWSADDQNITLTVTNKGNYNFSWSAWY